MDVEARLAANQLLRAQLVDAVERIDELRHLVRQRILAAEAGIPSGGGRGHRQRREPPSNEPQSGVEACLRSTNTRFIGPPFLVDAFTLAPAPNPDAASLDPAHGRLTDYPAPKKFSKSEREALKAHVHEQLARRHQPGGSAVAATGDTDDSYTDVDWEQVVLAPRLRRCTSHDAKVQWFARDRPGLNHGRWAAAETSQLMDLARELQGYRWDLVAKRLGTGRTPFQCFARYQQEVKKLTPTLPWTAEEDATLAEAVAEYGHWWTRVASTLPGRDRKQVHHRWVNTVSPSVKQGPYSQEELLRLRVAIEATKTEAGPQFATAARFVEGRTASQLRDRWVRLPGNAKARRGKARTNLHV